MLSCLTINSLDSMSQFIEMFGNQDVNDRSWNESIVKDEFTLTMGKTPARNNPAFWQSGTNKWISISDMARYGRYTEDTQESITDIAVAESGIKIVPKGTIIMSFKLSIGRTAVTSENIYTNEAIMAFRDVDGTKFNMTFLQFLIANKNWLLNAKQAVKGQTLNKESIGNARIIVPPIGLQEQFAAIYNQADKSGFDGRKSQFIEMFGSVDDNPKSYDIKKVGDFAECFAGATPSTKISSYWDNGNIPWMSSGEVHKARVQDTDAKITQQGYDGCSTKMVPIHSIVIALAGQGKTRGTVAINDIELCTNQSLCAIVPNEEVNYEYLFHNLRGRYKELRSMSGDVDGRGGLNLKHIQSIKVIVPPMSEQMKFVSIARQADKSKFGWRIDEVG